MNSENNHTPLSDTEIQTLAEEIVQGEVDALQIIHGVIVDSSVFDFLLRVTKSIIEAGEFLNTTENPENDISIEDVVRVIRHLNPDNVPTDLRSTESEDISSYLFPRCVEKASKKALYRSKDRIKPFLEEIKERDCDQFAPDLESIQACIDYKKKADFALGLIES